MQQQSDGGKRPPRSPERRGASATPRPVADTFPGTLSRWPVPRDNEILVAPLGGLGRIGMNWTLYGTKGRWILVDAGIAFSDEKDVDALIPDPAVLRPLLGRIDGLVVTHAHEDHIGAIAMFWPDSIRCPIHASPFAAEAIARRLDEAGSLSRADIRVFEPGGTFDAGPFSVRTIAVTHSVPEPVALAISCPSGTVVHTGDWKLDPTPLIGKPADTASLREVGDAGVLAMVCDSTNADRDLPFTSEAMVREAFSEVASKAPGAVVFCCFATNVARVASAAFAAEASGRKVALAGRSMRNNESIADKLGMLDGVPQFLAETSHLEGLDKREIALVCTGTQGEERAALSRLARGDWRLPKLGRGDTLVMSARVIPGNEKSVETVLSRLRARGVKVLDASGTAGGYPLHVSGHAGRAELREMHRLVRPRFVIPVHGERHHLDAHAMLAAECGAEAAPVGSEGEVFSVSAAGGLRSIGQVRFAVHKVCNGDDGRRPSVSFGERPRAPAAAAPARFGKTKAA